MELTLSTKNNYCTIFITIICILINNCYAESNIPAKKPKKYHNLQVELTAQDSDNQELLELIKQDLLIVKAISEPKLTWQRIDNLHYRANAEIIENLQSLGFYHAKVIHSSLINLSPYSWLAKYQVSIAKPTIIKKIDLDIQGDAANNPELTKNIQNILNRLLIINHRLVHDNYEKAKQLILNQMHDYGFLDAKFIKSTMAVNLANNSSDIILHIDSRQQYYFGQVIFESDVYNDDFLTKYLPFQEKDRYSALALANLKHNLLNSGLFSKVRIDTPKQLDSNQTIVPIKVRLYVKPANNYTAGIGYGTDTGIRGNVGYSRRRRSHPGHDINVKLSASKIRKQVIATYGLLGANPRVDKYNFGVSGQDVQVKQRLHKNLEFFGQKIKKYTNKEQLFRLSFLSETFKELPASEKKQAHFLMPSVHLSWTHPKFISATPSYNKITDTPNEDKTVIFGNKINLVIKSASKAVASSVNLLQFNLKEKWIQPIIYDARLIFKANAATTIVSEFDKLPHSLRFFAGGDNSVRGFAYNSLGPFTVDSTGNKGVIGGRHLLVFNLEIEKPIPIYDSLVLAGFLDAGNAFNNMHFDQLAMGAGFGIGYRTPIGSVKAYLAKPIKHLSFADGHKKKGRFHLTFGADL
jgi:translocation and assembly module TamA